MAGRANAGVGVTVAVGVLLSADGLASRTVLEQDDSSWIGVRSRHDAWASPASELRYSHELPILLTCDGHAGHPVVGEVIGLHRDKGRGGIIALGVAEIHDQDRLLEHPGPIYFSAVADAAVRPGSAIGHDIRLRAAAITTTPARLCPEPILLLPGTLRDHRRWNLTSGPAARAVDETIAQRRHRGDSGVLYVTGGPDDQPTAHAPDAWPRASLPARGRGEAWRHQPGWVVSVH